MISDKDRAAIRAAGMLEGIHQDLGMLSDRLKEVPLWRPGAVLRKQIEEADRFISDMETRIERALVVTILGPGGAGKSTILNALAGVDGLSPAGHDRPTTRQPLILTHDDLSARSFQEETGGEKMAVRSSPEAVRLKYVLLVDTPDIDGMQKGDHLPIVENVIRKSDVLICVFDGENPKRKDYVDFLAPFVSRFDGGALVCVVNRCDRLEEKELKEVVVPDFTRFIRDAWDKPAENILCVSARSNLRDPAWDPKAPPRHDFDQFPALRNLVFGKFNHAGFVIDRRLESAGELRNFLRNEITREIGKDETILKEALQLLCAAEKNAVNQAVSTLRGRSGRMPGIGILLYQDLAWRWTGPVGWIIALWTRILLFGSGIVAMLRFGNPIHQAYGMVSSFKRYRETKEAMTDAGSGERVDEALRKYRLALIQDWPRIAESLVEGRFADSVREMDEIPAEQESLGRELSLIWQETVYEVIDSGAKKWSGIFLQLLFNIPSLVAMGYAGWIIGRSFFSGNYLPGDFFLHAFAAVAIILFFSFFLFQGLLSLFSGPDRLIKRSLAAVRVRTDEDESILAVPLRRQVSALLGLISRS